MWDVVDIVNSFTAQITYCFIGNVGDCNSGWMDMNGDVMVKYGAQIIVYYIVLCKMLR